MKLITVTVAVLAIFGGQSSAKNFGAINVQDVGDIYVVGPDWTSDFITMNGKDGFTLQ